MKKTLVFLTILLVTVSCKKECVFNENFLHENAETMPKLLQIFSDDSACENLRLKGVFYYQPKEYKLDKKIYPIDSTYAYSLQKEDIFLDFSLKKRPGVLKINDTLNVQVNYLMDIDSNKGTFRLFKINEIGDYHGLDLSIVLVANYNYGIVGDFVSGEENGDFFVVGYAGYMPNKEYFLSIFKPAELL